MIEIVAESENLQKNVRQIGTPADEDKIYIADEAYKRIHSVAGPEKNVFVLMGHTEKSGGKYATFIENVIKIDDIQYEQNVPIWSNRVWSTVFDKIKSHSEDSIIVGWALDLRGYSVEKPSEIERIHREQFGGRHQLFYMLDTTEGEECFFVNRNNHLYKKEGFYIYYKISDKSQKEEVETPEINPRRIEEETNLVTHSTGGRYRQILNMEQKSVKSAYEVKGSMGSVLMVGMIAVMVVIIGTGIFSKDNMQQHYNGAVQTMGENVHNMQEHNSKYDKSIASKNKKGNDEKIDSSTETAEVIPVEKLSE